jgi:hypothetical protein
VEREATELGFGAGGEMVRLENGDGDGDCDSLRFYVASTKPQMPEIDGVVNLFFAQRTKERYLIFGACWRDCSARCEVKFLGGQIIPSD